MGDTLREAVSLDLRTAQVATALSLAPERFARFLRTGLLRYMGSFVAPRGPWQRAWMTGRPGLKRRSGELARAFRALDVGGSDLGSIAALTFTTSRYARIHEKGGTIVAKPRQVTVTRRVHAVASSRRRPSQLDQATYTYTRTLLIWRDEQGHYHSARQVTIPPRLHFFDSFARDEGGRSILLRDVAARALADDGGGQPIRRSNRGSEHLGPGGDPAAPAPGP